MRTFHCDNCSSLVFFDNVQCVTCGHALRFISEVLDLAAVEVECNYGRALSARTGGSLFRRCRNDVEHGVCNWLVPLEDDTEWCEACRLNDIIPDLSVDGNHHRWEKLEAAKRRLLFTLRTIGVSWDASPESGAKPLRFRFLGDSSDGTRPVTGHNNGVITIDIAEADDLAREECRVRLREPFRTLLGNFRHEAAHYYWDRLVANSPRLDEFRRIFGDERVSYSDALQHHHEHGPPRDWPELYITAYASAHPWEDWAETTAHYFHMVDTIETAASLGLSLSGRQPGRYSYVNAPAPDGTDRAEVFDMLMARWVPLTIALNAINRGVGLPDLYPFVISDVARAKMQFVHATFLSRPNVGRCLVQRAGRTRLR
jgi:hypothetical protein